MLDDEYAKQTGHQTDEVNKKRTKKALKKKQGGIINRLSEQLKGNKDQHLDCLEIA